MPRAICIIDGHPDGDPGRLIHALAEAYAEGALSAGHEVSRIRISELEFPLLTSNADFQTPPPEPVLSERNKIAAADHVVILFPLWLGSMPAKLRGFFEQAARASFFIGLADAGAHWPSRMMEGKSLSRDSDRVPGAEASSQSSGAASYQDHDSDDELMGGDTYSYDENSLGADPYHDVRERMEELAADLLPADTTAEHVPAVQLVEFDPDAALGRHLDR